MPPDPVDEARRIGHMPLLASALQLRSWNVAATAVMTDQLGSLFFGVKSRSYAARPLAFLPGSLKLAPHLLH